MELVVMEGGSGKEILFVRAIQQEKPLRSLLQIHCPKGPTLFLIERLAEAEAVLAGLPVIEPAHFWIGVC